MGRNKLNQPNYVATLANEERSIILLKSLLVVLLTQSMKCGALNDQLILRTAVMKHRELTMAIVRCESDKIYIGNHKIATTARYECKFCKKTFACKSALEPEIHQKVHTCERLSNANTAKNHSPERVLK